MKKCRRCSKPAMLHITEIREGKAVAIHLCESCAREYLDSKSEEEKEPTSSDLQAKLEELVSSESDESLVCPTCGITFAEFRENGRFGCPQDYTVFAAELAPLLENIHEETTHVGKRPRHNEPGTNEQSELIQLRNRLRDAVEAEDYESAAALRDQIAVLEEAMRKGKPAPKRTRKKKKAEDTPTEDA
ncbi:MAG: UvrB/UvrC motif-containing protein [Planctomycetaceae bacterium]|nr:UvrB/UvrC motif-containing protein [Planctomycetaceae bacterium]MCA9063311.1 UvrB/UvrC motif-containing protein [Planctomycetaceae bacterium]